ncbi:MAG: SPOR domain-containing protein [Tannerellaceae bacterium]|jgi:hypothetical protein|nr:SPOR domain-containing protein [Tannerellaceae bacterium]
MKHKSKFIVLTTFLACTTNLSAQIGLENNSQSSKTSIFDELQTPGPGKGKVIIDQPSGIRNLVGSQIIGEIKTTNDGRSYIQYQGFRVQIFSGNEQRTAKEEALKREREIKDAMPDLNTYVNFDAPFWRLRVGDFTSREEAYDVQIRLMQLLPKYKKETYIVKEEIKLLLNESPN